jgi:NADH-quinone oxidoreductase subunit E
MDHSLLSSEICHKIDKWVAKYPSDQKQSAVIPALHLVQDENEGWLSTELLDAVASYLDMPKIAVYEVATFYSMFELEKTGNRVINVCTNISCMLSGSAKIVDHLEKRLDVKLGGTTKDGRYTLREVECLAACTNAPMCQIGKKYHEKLTPEKVDTMLDGME